MDKLNKIGRHKTTVTGKGGETIVTYHQTQVVVFDSNKIVLDSGGWLTNTTKLRMNQTSRQYDLKYHVYQTNFEWFVTNEKTGETFDFKDGIEILRN